MNIKKQLLYTHLVFNLIPPSKFTRNQERIHLLDSSQSPIFPRDRHCITRLTVNGRHLDFQMYRWGGRRGLYLQL